MQAGIYDPIVVHAFLNVRESDWADIQSIAESKDYIERLIDKHEIRSFIISLKRGKGSISPLNLNAICA